MPDEGRSLTQPSGGFSRRSPCETDAAACGALFGAAVGGVPQPRHIMPTISATLARIAEQNIGNLPGLFSHTRKSDCLSAPGQFFSRTREHALDHRLEV